MDYIADGQSTKVNKMSRFQKQFVDEHEIQMDTVEELMSENDDLAMEEILENLDRTPLGQVLKRVASMPEVRQKKVLEVRKSLSQGQYSLNDRLDKALERVLEDLKA